MLLGSLLLSALASAQTSTHHSSAHSMLRASYYADGFNGRKMSNGQKFSQTHLSAASRQFPLGSILAVSAPSTGKVLYVTVTDRGPWCKKYSLDLSKAAFTALGFDLTKGWGWVIVKELRTE